MNPFSLLKFAGVAGMALLLSALVTYAWMRTLEQRSLSWQTVDATALEFDLTAAEWEANRWCGLPRTIGPESLVPEHFDARLQYGSVSEYAPGYFYGPGGINGAD